MVETYAPSVAPERIRYLLTWLEIQNNNIYARTDTFDSRQERMAFISDMYNLNRVYRIIKTSEAISSDNLL